MEKIIKNETKLVLCYGISFALAVCYLVFFEFSFNVFLPALVSVLTIWLDRRTFISNNKQLGLMWLIFNFGLLGLIASLFRITSVSGNTVYVVGVTFAAIVCFILQAFMKKIFVFIDNDVVTSDEIKRIEFEKKSIKKSSN